MKHAGKAIHFARVNFFLSFLMIALIQNFLGYTGPFFTTFSPHVKYMFKFYQSGPHFLIIPQGKMPWQPIFFCKIGKLTFIEHVGIPK